MGEPQFDHQKAQALIDTLTDAIRLLKSQTSDRSTKARAMQTKKDWTGPYADQFFNTEVPRMKNGASALVTQMQGLITQLHNASTSASQATSSWQWNHEPHPSPGPAPSPPTGTTTTTTTPQTPSASPGPSPMPTATPTP